MMQLLRSFKDFWAGKKTVSTLVGLATYLLMCSVTATEVDQTIVSAFLGSSVWFAKLGQFRANKALNGKKTK